MLLWTAVFSPALQTLLKINSPNAAVPCTTSSFELWAYDSWSCLATLLSNSPSTLLLILPLWKPCIHEDRNKSNQIQFIWLWFSRTGLLPKPSSLFFANISCHNVGQIGYECLSCVFQTGSSKIHAIQWGQQGTGGGKVDWWWRGGAMTNKTATKKKRLHLCKKHDLQCSRALM